MACFSACSMSLLGDNLNLILVHWTKISAELTGSNLLIISANLRMLAETGFDLFAEEGAHIVL